MDLPTRSWTTHSCNFPEHYRMSVNPTLMVTSPWDIQIINYDHFPSLKGIARILRCPSTNGDCHAFSTFEQIAKWKLSQVLIVDLKERLNWLPQRDEHFQSYAIPIRVDCWHLLNLRIFARPCFDSFRRISESPHDWSIHDLILSLSWTTDMLWLIDPRSHVPVLMTLRMATLQNGVNVVRQEWTIWILSQSNR
jgi:hypothetical protein